MAIGNSNAHSKLCSYPRQSLDLIQAHAAAWVIRSINAFEASHPFLQIIE